MRAIRFIERYCRHVQGPYAGKLVRLLPWERDTIAHAFGWVHRETGVRRYRIVYTFIPRKNGKSTLAACVMLYLLFADGEKGAQIYSAAADRFQASIVFDIARRMVEQAPELKRRARVMRRVILVPATWSSYQVLSADVYTKHGLNPHGIGFDELHTQPSRDLYDVLHTGSGARLQPLEWIMSTAGFEDDSFWAEFHRHAIQVAEGKVADDRFLPVLYGLARDDDWTDPALWREVNPSLGAGVTEDYLREECEKAVRLPSYQNVFRRLHLNILTKQETKWMDMVAWDDCGRLPLDPAALKGAPCYGGADLGSKLDLTAFALWFPPSPATGGAHALLVWFWMPQDGVQRRVMEDLVPYDLWIEKGLIRTTPGAITDHEIVCNEIAAICQEHRCQEIAIDRWGAIQLFARLEARGLKPIEYGLGIKSMKDPTAEFEALAIARKVAHGGNLVLRWMADNVQVWQDAAGNMKPDKGKSREKIDGIVAGILALGRVLAHAPAGPSIYETQGFELL